MFKLRAWLHILFARVARPPNSRRLLSAMRIICDGGTTRSVSGRALTRAFG